LKLKSLLEVTFGDEALSWLAAFGDEVLSKSAAFGDEALSQSAALGWYYLLTGDSDQGCLGNDYCPDKCTCTGTVVRCSRVRLQEIPRGIPPETSEL
jgi:hypothetical protein